MDGGTPSPQAAQHTLSVCPGNRPMPQDVFPCTEQVRMHFVKDDTRSVHGTARALAAMDPHGARLTNVLYSEAEVVEFDTFVDKCILDVSAAAPLIISSDIANFLTSLCWKVGAASGRTWMTWCRALCPVSIVAPPPPSCGVRPPAASTCSCTTSTSRWHWRFAHCNLKTHVPAPPFSARCVRRTVL